MVSGSLKPEALPGPQPSTLRGPMPPAIGRGRIGCCMRTGACCAGVMLLRQAGSPTPAEPVGGAVVVRGPLLPWAREPAWSAEEQALSHNIPAHARIRHLNPTIR